MAKAPTKAELDKITRLMDHYSKGTEDADTRRTRKNGWNDVLNCYMGVLPKNWPYTSVVTDPRVRTTILEKTARLLNAKLQGRLVPREGGDIVKARINNAILDFQWDNASEGGSMLEKMALSDQTARIFGAAFALVYWDNEKDTNELKPIDPRDIFIDFSATHIRNARWVQLREFTTLKNLEAQGFEMGSFKSAFKQGRESVSDNRSTVYDSVVKSNRGLEDKTGQDMDNPTLEVVTEYTRSTETTFLPRYGLIIRQRKNPYEHGSIPIAQLRYYPLGDDIYGESEVESVIPLQRAINAVLCGFLDEMNLAMRPPVKLVHGQYRAETIEYGPGAKWIVNSPGAATEMQMGTGAIQNFNSTYPALVAAFNTAMGDQSLGVSNLPPFQTSKTATEIMSTERQQNNRDQYNQMYLSEFLKEIMLMWLSNNQEFLFDDPTKLYKVVKIIGKDNVQAFQQMQLDDTDIPAEAMAALSDTIQNNPEAVSNDILTKAVSDLSVPVNPVVENPNDQPSAYRVHKKLELQRPDEASLYVTKEDLDGVYDYIPDVKSMAAGAGIMAQQARQKALDMTLNPQIVQMLQSQGEMLKIKEVLVSSLEDAGLRDAESFFQPTQYANSGNPANAGGSQIAGSIPGGTGLEANTGLSGLPSALPSPAQLGGMARSQGLQQQ